MSIGKKKQKKMTYKLLTHSQLTKTIHQSSWDLLHLLPTNNIKNCAALMKLLDCLRSLL